MVESKRFYCKKDGVNEWVVCDRLKQFPMPVSSLEFCGAVENALNSLWGEIWRLENHSQELVQRSIKYEDTINELKNENKRLKEEIRLLNNENKELKEKLASSFLIRGANKRTNETLEKENEELRGYNRAMVKDIKDLEERNNRQAEQLDRLYKLIEAKDWEALTGIIEDFRRCEEQLKREWGRY